MLNDAVISWQQSIVTIVILFWFAFIICGTLVGLWLCNDNNRWGILIASLALPILGTIIALTIMQIKYDTVDKWLKEKPKKEKKHKKQRKSKKPKKIKKTKKVKKPKNKKKKKHR